MASGGDVRVYRISPWRRGLFAGLGLLIMLPFLISGIVTGNGGLFLGCGLIALIWAPCYYLVHAARLILSAEGVAFRQVGYHLSSTWENVVRLWLLKGQEGFELAQPMNNFSAKMLSGTADTQFVIQGAAIDPVPGEARRGLVIARQFIPIEAFAYYFEKGDLLDEIRRFAPRLAEAPLRQPEPTAEAATADATAAEPESSNSSNVLLISIIVGAVILGMLMGMNVLPLNVQWGVANLLRAVVFICLAIYAVYNFTWSVIFARSGRWGRAALAVVFAVMQVLFCFALAADNL